MSARLLIVGCAALSILFAPRARAQAPSVRDLQRWAVARAGLDPERYADAARRARLAPLLPTLRIGGGRSGRAYTALSLVDADPRLTQLAGDGWQAEASASWSLDRIAFATEEAQLLREEQRAAVRRQRLEAEVARLYFTRERLLAQLTVTPEAERPELLLRIDEITAVLDAWTGHDTARGPGRSPP